jgi:hypothetical protein
MGQKWIHQVIELLLGGFDNVHGRRSIRRVKTGKNIPPCLAFRGLVKKRVFPMHVAATEEIHCFDRIKFKDGILLSLPEFSFVHMTLFL